MPARLFRLSRYTDVRTFTEWRYLANAEPGRWADPEGEYRVLYAADSEVGAYVEILQDLRPRAEALDLLRSIDDDGHFDDVLGSAEAAALKRLRQYYFFAFIPDPDDRIVDLEAPASRTEIERGLADDLPGRRVKIGDFSSRDYGFTRRVSRYVFTALADDGREYAGMAARSAEHPSTNCFAYFETGRETGALVGRIVGQLVYLALSRDDIASEAIAFIVS